MMKQVFLLCVCALLLRVGAAEVLSEAELAIKKIKVPKGFKLELVAAEPMLVNPVAFTIDSQGRFYVVETHRFNNSVFDITQNTNWLRQDLALHTVTDRVKLMSHLFATNLSVLTTNSERIRLIEDLNHDGRADRAETFADGFNKIESGIAAGAFVHNDKLWFTCIPDLIRFDLDTQGRPTSRQTLSTGYGVHIGVTGHDLHGVTMGPDGRIYFSSGDRGFSVTTKDGKFDYPHTGGVLRCNPDGTGLEVFATGLRNPQELTFDQYGNLWAGDNDTAGEDKSRLIHVVEGGDYGWRCSYQHMVGFGPWVQENVWQGGVDGMLPHSGEVAQGPAGFAFYPGTGLPSEYDNHFFMCDFPGGIYSFQIQPQGASFVVTNRQQFVWNILPTDADFGPDGNLYILDWVEGWTLPEKGRIYRLRYEGLQNDSSIASVREFFAKGFKQRSLAELRDLLSHKNLRVRQAAQFALVDHGIEAAAPLLAVARESKQTLPRLHAIWGLGQLHRNGFEIPRPLISAWLSDPDPEIRSQAARLAGETYSTTLAHEIVRLLRDPEPRVRFFALQALGKTKTPSVADAIFALLKENNDRDAYLVHAAVHSLIQLGDWTRIEVAAKSNDRPVRRAALLAYRRTGRAEISRFLKDREAQLVNEAARAIYDVPIPAALPELARTLNRLPGEAMSRCLNAHFRLGLPDNAATVAEFALRTNAPPRLRKEAIELLEHWNHPDEIDRIVGLWRPVAAGGRADGSVAFGKAFPTLLAESSEFLTPAVLQTARKAGRPEWTAPLLAAYETELPPPVKAEMLDLLGDWKAPGLEQMVTAALQRPEPELRLAALKQFSKVKLPGAASTLETVLEDGGDRALKQAAWAALAATPGPKADELLQRGKDRLSQGGIPAELQLDVFEAAAKFNPGFKEEMLLQGGDAANGKTIFQEKAATECLRCHTVKGKGGVVGPKLDGIGARRDRQYLLDSLLHPNKEIAPGFENVLITLKDGRTVAGLVSRETAEQLEINSPEDGKTVIAKGTIAKRARTLSAMPEGLDKLLSRRELRDLIEYLRTLR